MRGPCFELLGRKLKFAVQLFMSGTFLFSKLTKLKTTFGILADDDKDSVASEAFKKIILFWN